MRQYFCCGRTVLRRVNIASVSSETTPTPGAAFGSLLFVAAVPGGSRSRWVMRCSCGVEREYDAKNVRTGNSTSCGATEHRREDLAGRRFGRLLVERDVRGADGRLRWWCRCDCGGSATTSAHSLKTSRTMSCGCLRVDAVSALAVDIAGKRFGRLTAIERVGLGGERGAPWRCVCDCGGEKVVPGPILRRGAVISCGCAAGGPRVRPKALSDYYNARTHERRARSRAAGGSFTAAQIDALYLAQRGRCACCRVKLNGVFHRDHRVALANGGTNDIGNIELLCGSCNQRKSAKDEIAWANENGRLL